jgi:hypothetical protein
LCGSPEDLRRRTIQAAPIQAAPIGSGTPSPGELAALMQYCPPCEGGGLPCPPPEKASLVLPVGALIVGYLLGKG